ncbi:hypothetical protein GE21DRAFT_1944 [Neurospora crassa]|uniref:Uncharacterized protein n=1 Tax=Neurospora crassa (strain ATCC 24698 / 74-OR23-1A / CBS 708.71 / DSM 1257 / FGSC 987) TaxID=367110 RepID=V5IRQ0_NEUCR|nr:hypothetical protein NCU16440 [Neurospora crassa OR74A]ESA44261.1 hypothetical protein NCU16440 [Neurospora crassa OR74A]KHE83702.1 hypothetical protein GE21DRAFT_1944 [Neurospora crassa]|eukprot:XP_011393408.1 hypothetical protein NCU16440 [Neurospora crassa OR74A]
MTGIRPGEDATPDTPLHPYPLQEWRVPWSHRNMFSRIKKLSAEADEHGVHQPLTHRLPCMVIAANNQDALPSQKALRKERKISGEAGDNKKRKKHNGETVEEKAERKKQKKSQLGSWRYGDRGNRSLEFVSDPVTC